MIPVAEGARIDDTMPDFDINDMEPIDGDQKPFDPFDGNESGIF